MPITINRPELLATLETVQHGLSKKDSIQQANCFVFRDGWCVTFNDEVSCRMRTSLPRDFEGAVPAEKLLEVMRKLPDEEVSFAPSKSELKIKASGNTTVSLRMEAEILLPVEQVEAPDEWHDLPEEFADAVKVVCDVAKESADEFLCRCVHVAGGRMEATDRLQIARYDVDVPGSDDPFLLQKTSVQPLAALNPVRVGRTAEWMHFKNDSKLFYSCRRHRFDYPPLDPILQFRGTATALPRSATEAAALAEIFASEDKEGLLFVTLAPGWMTVRGVGTSGWAEKTLKAEYNGPELEFRMGPDLLTRVVGKSRECEIGPNKYGKPTLRIDGDGWTYMTSLGNPTADRPPDEPARNGKGRHRDEEPEPVGAGDETED